MDDLKRVVGAYVACLCVAVFLVYAVQFLPDTALRDTMPKAIANLSTNGPRPQLLPNMNFSTVDWYADGVLLQLSLTDPRVSQIENALGKRWLVPETAQSSIFDTSGLLQKRLDGEETNSSYARYWHGSTVFIRTFGSALPYLQLLLLNALVLLVLLVASVRAILKWQGALVSVAYLAALILTSVYIVPFSLSFVSCYYVLFLSVIALSWIYKNNRQRTWLLTYFFVVGAAVSFLDFFTVPFVTLGIPLALVLAHYSMQVSANTGAAFRQYMLCVASWAAGFVALFMSKIGLALLIPAATSGLALESQFGKYSYASMTFSDAVMYVLFQALPTFFAAPFASAASSAPPEIAFSSWLSLALSILVIGAPLGYLALKRAKAGTAAKIVNPQVVLLLVAALPLSRLLLLPVHLTGHSFMVGREMAVIYFAVFLYAYAGVQRLKRVRG